MSFADRIPFSYRVVKTKKITSAGVDTLLTRAPWQAPINKYYRIIKVVITNYNGSAGTLSLWDQDLSSTTPATRGSAGAALVNLSCPGPAASGAGISNTVTFGSDALPNERFEAGITAQMSNSLNTFVMLELSVQ
jgi:hypothetical protein